MRPTRLRPLSCCSLSLALATLSFVSACRGKRHSSPATTVASGVYDVSSPLCQPAAADATASSTATYAPTYPTVERQLALFDFKTLKSHQLRIDAQSATEFFSSETCTLSLTRSLVYNTDAWFALGRDRQFAWQPADCTLELVFGGAPYTIGQEYSTLFQDNETPGAGSTAELPYRVSLNDQVYTLVTADTPELSGAFAAFGCAKTDRMQFTLTTASSK